MTMVFDNCKAWSLFFTLYISFVPNQKCLALPLVSSRIPFQYMQIIFSFFKKTNYSFPLLLNQLLIFILQVNNVNILF